MRRWLPLLPFLVLLFVVPAGGQITVWQADQNFVNAVVASFGACPSGQVMSATQIGVAPRCVTVGGSGMAVSTLPCGVTVSLTSDGTTSIQLEYVTLCSNVTTLNAPAAGTMPDGKIIYLAVQQPMGGFNYTLPSCFTSPSLQIYVTNNVAGGTQGFCGGSGVLPGMPTAAFAELDFALHYRATQPAGGTPTLRVMGASQ